MHTMTSWRDTQIIKPNTHRLLAHYLRHLDLDHSLAVWKSMPTDRLFVQIISHLSEGHQTTPITMGNGTTRV